MKWWEDLAWDQIPVEVRDLLVAVQYLIDTTLEPTEDFPVAFVRPGALEDVKKALHPMSIRYRLSRNEAS